MKTAAIYTLGTILMIQGATFLASAADNDPSRLVADAGNRFARDLYARLSEKPGNLFFSPHSIHAALTMTAGGAHGNTSVEMAGVLGLPAIAEPTHAGYDQLFKALSNRRKEGDGADHTLAVANALFAQQEFPFRDDYIRLTREKYQAGLFNVDFVSRTEPTRVQINEWVSRQTRNKIADLFAPGVLNSQTRMVLVNAIYFKGAWLTAFPKAATRDEMFHVTGEIAKKTPMMHVTKKFGYRETDTVQALELPYRGNALSMWVLLPKERNGLAKFEKTMTTDVVRELTARAASREVIVSMPRFKMTQEFSLSDTLKAMGMKEAFAAGQADFGGMTDKDDLYLQAVVHKAFVDVTEEGTEAAAATGVAIGVTSMPVRQEPVVFKADHPFVFLIRHNQTGAILFMGRLSEPSS